MIAKYYHSLTPRQKELAPYLGLVLAVFLAYCNIYTNTFLFDDGLIITLNQYLRSWSHFGNILTGSTTEGAHIAGGFYRPVQMVLYFFIFQLTGDSVFGFHLLNVSLHAINACLLFALGRKLNFNKGASFLGCLIWAMHPLHVEAVTYMSSTADTLHVLFCLASILYLLPDFAPRKFFLVIPFFLLALFSKEVSIVFPALVICCMFFFSDRRKDIKSYLRTWPLWAVAGLYLAWRLTTPYLDGPASYDRVYQMAAYENMRLYSKNFGYRLYTFFATIPAYLQITLWPQGLHMERSFSVFVDFWTPQVLIGAFMTVAAILFIFFNKNQKNQPAAWGLMWFGAAHFPDSGIAMGVNSLFLEHWMYLPLSGLFLGLAQTLYLHLENLRSARMRNAAVCAALLVAAALGIVTFAQNRVWRDPVTFYTHMFKYGVVSARAHNNLALAYIDRHEPQKAIAEFNKAIDIGDTYAETHHNLAIALLNLPDRYKYIDEAIAHLNRSLEIDPNFYRSYIVLSQIYAYQGDGKKADAYREKAEAILNGYNR